MKKVTFYVTNEYYDKIKKAMPRIEQYLNKMDLGNEVSSQEWNQEVADCGTFGVLKWLLDEAITENL